VTELLRTLANGGGREIRVVIARPQHDLIAGEALASLPPLVRITQIGCARTHATAMRNALIDAVDTSHVLFLDDDMVPAGDLYERAVDRARLEPAALHQGPPYLVANPQKWLARMEGRLYEETYASYVAGRAVSLLDARLLLAPTAALRSVRFDESFRYAGEGRQLATSLQEHGVSCVLAPDLVGYHINRATLRELCRQKRMHGWGRAHALRKNGPGASGWLGYAWRYAVRHYVVPVAELFRKEHVTVQDVAYRYLTNTVFWFGVVEAMMLRRSDA